jgi:hypothetical protein
LWSVAATGVKKSARASVILATAWSTYCGKRN